MAGAGQRQRRAGRRGGTRSSVTGGTAAPSPGETAPPKSCIGPYIGITRSRHWAAPCMALSRASETPKPPSGEGGGGGGSPSVGVPHAQRTPQPALCSPVAPAHLSPRSAERSRRCGRAPARRRLGPARPAAGRRPAARCGSSLASAACGAARGCLLVGTAAHTWEQEGGGGSPDSTPPLPFIEAGGKVCRRPVRTGEPRRRRHPHRDSNP